MFLSRERTTLQKFFPGLDEKLSKIPLMEMECPNSQAIQLFRQHDGPGLMIPTKHKGKGATLLDAIQITRALGSRSPSLAVATTMHHISSIMIQEMVTNQSGFDLLERVAKNNLYFSSGFAEGRTQDNILNSSMQVELAEGGLVISGSKKPCTLSTSMDLMTASIILPNSKDQSNELAMAVIPAETSGIERYPFWNSWALMGTESNEVRLRQVYVPNKYIYNIGDPSRLNPVLNLTFSWFTPIASAAYLGIASALVERTLIAGKGLSSERVALATEVEGAMSALEGLACSIMNGEQDEGVVARALFVRYLVQSTIECVTMHAAEILGGIAFIKSPEVAYLLSSARALAFHPPSRLNVASGLDNYLIGKPLEI